MVPPSSNLASSKNFDMLQRMSYLLSQAYRLINSSVEENKYKRNADRIKFPYNLQLIGIPQGTHNWLDVNIFLEVKYNLP